MMRQENSSAGKAGKETGERGIGEAGGGKHLREKVVRPGAQVDAGSGLCEQETHPGTSTGRPVNPNLSHTLTFIRTIHCFIQTDGPVTVLVTCPSSLSFTLPFEP